MDNRFSKFFACLIDRTNKYLHLSMISSKRFLLLVLVFFCRTGFSQLNVDSLLGVFNNPKLSDSVRLVAIDMVAWDGYLYANQDSAIYFANLQYEFAKKNKQDKQMALALNTIGAAYDILGEYQKAIYYYKESLQSRREQEDLKGVASSLNNIGTVYRNQGNFKEAVEYFLESYKIKQEIGDKKGSANSLLGIGNVFIEQGEYDEALKYFQKSLVIREEIQDKKGIASSLLSIGNVYWQRKEYDQSIEYYEKSYFMQKELGDMLGMSGSLNNLAVLSQHQGNLKKALEYYTLSMDIREQLGDKLGLCTTYSNLGVVYQKMGNFKKAIEFGLKSLQLSNSIGAIRQIKDAYGTLYETYKLNKQYQQSLDMYENFIRLRDSILSDENHKAITKLELEFEYEIKATADSIQHAEEQKLKDAQLLTQQAENDKQSAELKVKRNQQYALFGGLALVLVFSGFMYNRFMVTKRQRDIIELQKIEVEKQREIADEQRRYAESQQHIVEEKNQEITDSINYAKRIQEAILPSRQALIDHLKNGFVLFKPKDVVSGDFYWLETYNKDISLKGNAGTQQMVYFAAADCTGHGVPGALVSVVCSNALSKSLLEDGCTETGKLLDRTRDLVVERFAKSGEEVKDGMDISLVALQRLAQSESQEPVNERPSVQTILQWSGANNPLWLINLNRTHWPENVSDFTDENGRVVGFQIRPDSQPIGLYDINEPFTTHEVPLEKGDTLYIFTDGYQDQFGGEKGKKFKASQLRDLLISIQHLDMDKQRDVLEDTYEQWRGQMEQIDDICVIGVRI